MAILSPAGGAVVGATSVDVTAEVTHPAGTTVVSVPAGVSETVPAGGGTVSGTVPLADEGPNTITVSASDASGNTGGTSIEVIRDTTAPAVTVTSPAYGAVVGDGPVGVTVEVADLTAVSLDVAGDVSGLAPGGGTVTVSVELESGANDIVVTATDAAGNTKTLTHRVVLDLDAPLVTIVSPADGDRFGAGGSPVEVVARVDDVSETTVTSSPAGVEDDLPEGGGVAIGDVELAEGTNTITVSATDEAGRTGSASITVVLDTTAPSVAFTAPLNGDAVRGTIDIFLASADPLPGSGVTEVVVTLDGEPLVVLTEAPFETALDTTLLDDGSHVLEATATDGLGNTSGAVSITVLVDNTPPVVEVTAPSDGAYVSGTADFEVDVSDATSGLVLATTTVGGAAPTEDDSKVYATPVAADTLYGAEDTTLRPDGPATFTATARDAAGNVATATVTVTVDNSNPTTALVSPQDGDVVRGTLRIEGNAADANLASLAAFVDGQEVGSSTTSPLVVDFDTTRQLDGATFVELRVTDTAGNVATSVAHVTVDNVAVDLKPAHLKLTSKGKGTAHVEASLSGPNLDLLLPLADHSVELRIPGGNAVPAVASGEVKNGKLEVRFLRSEVVASIRAGIDGGAIDAEGRRVEVTLVADGRVLGTTVVGFTEAK